MSRSRFSAILLASSATATLYTQHSEINIDRYQLQWDKPFKQSPESSKTAWLHCIGGKTVSAAETELNGGIVRALRLKSIPFLWVCRFCPYVERRSDESNEWREYDVSNAALGSSAAHSCSCVCTVKCIHLSSDHVLSSSRLEAIILACKHNRMNHLVLVSIDRETNRISSYDSLLAHLFKLRSSTSFCLAKEMLALESTSTLMIWSRTPRRVRGSIPIDRVLILVDIVVNQGNDTLEARRIVENLLLLKSYKMVAWDFRGSMLELPSLQKK